MLAARGRTLPPVSNASDRKICMPPILSFGQEHHGDDDDPDAPEPLAACCATKGGQAGMMSSPPITVEPVVVIPDIASKNAFVKSSRGAPRHHRQRAEQGQPDPDTRGDEEGLLQGEPLSHPVRRRQGHRKAPRGRSRCRPGRRLRRCPSRNRDRPAIGTAIDTPRKVTSSPITYPTGRRSIMAPMLGVRDAAGQPRNGGQALLGAGEMPFAPGTKTFRPGAGGRKPSPRERGFGRTGVEALAAKVSPSVSTLTASWECRLSWCSPPPGNRPTLWSACNSAAKRRAASSTKIGFARVQTSAKACSSSRLTITCVSVATAPARGPPRGPRSRAPRRRR